MTSKHWLRKRLSHKCTIQRDNGTAQSNTGMIGTAWSEVGSAVVCRYYESNELVPDERLGRITIKTRYLLLDESQDIKVNDRVRSVIDKSGNSLHPEALIVNRLVSPTDIEGDRYYRKALLERRREANDLSS